MGGLWWQAALQLSASLLFVALSMPLFRRAALYVGLVDLPSTRKVHEAPIPYLGGLAIFIGVDASMVMSGGFSREANLVLLGGGAACALGLVDDWRSVRPVLRVVAEGILAVALAAGGVRLHVTGRTALDSILTVCFLMAAPNALNLCDNMDALAGGLALTVSMSAAAIGAWYADPAILSLSVAVTGALIGYLVYNGPPATIFMGDSGSLMLGVLLGGLVCLCTQRVGGAGHGLAAASAFAVIFLDTLTVVVARPRHGRKVSDAGKDHLSHRLTLLGMGKERAVLVLVLHSAVVGLLGTLAATHHLAPVAALSVVVLVTAALAFICSVAPVYARAELVPPETLAVDLRERRASTQQQPVPIAAGSRVW